jgi:hypothetical protein
MFPYSRSFLEAFFPVSMTGGSTITLWQDPGLQELTPTLTKSPRFPSTTFNFFLHLNIMADQPDQPALGPNGQLLDATEIEWHNDPDDPRPIQPAPSGSTGARSPDFGLGGLLLIHSFGQVSAHVQSEQLQAHG